MRCRGWAVVLVCLLMTAGCSSEEPAPAPAPPDAGALRLAVVGDSITAGDSPDLPAGELGEESWVSHAVGGEIAFAGGWAVWGATTAQMAAGVEPVDADAVVVLAGTNDVGSGVPFDQTAANIAEVVETLDVPRVLLSSVPPIDSAPELAVQLNADLEALAVAREWEFVDAAAPLREGDRFAPGMTSDGVHPTAQGARELGAAIRAALLGEE